MKKNFLLILLLLSCSSIFAQKTVTGTVTDAATQETVIGASVQIKNRPGVGVSTDINGNYTISAQSSDILMFSFVGMIPQEMAVADRSVIHVALMPDNKQLDELVVIGYGQVKKSDLTGSVAVVTKDELIRNPASNAAEALQGKAAGVLVTKDVNGSPSIRVRGIGTINSDPKPIIIVDGVPGDLNGIQPSDIETFQVLKDASATAIYGANGTNGVIIVTTKRGSAGKPIINYNGYTSYNLAPKQYKMMNADQYVDFYRNVKGDNPAYSDEFRSAYYGQGWREGTNWQNQVFRNAWSQNHNLSVSGGSDNSNFSMSFGYNRSNSTINAKYNESYIVRINSDFRINKYIKVGETLVANHSPGRSSDLHQISEWDVMQSPLMKVYNPELQPFGYEGNSITYYLDDNGEARMGSSPGKTAYVNTAGNDKPSPLPSLMHWSNQKRSYSFKITPYIQIDFTDWLMFKTMYSGALGGNSTRVLHPAFLGNRGPSTTIGRESKGIYMTNYIENQLLFNKNFNDAHNVQATIVQTASLGKDESVEATGTGFPYEGITTINTALETKGMSYRGSSSEYSYLGRLIYDYKGKYYLTASIRHDAISSLPPGHKTGNFKAFSLAWKANEDIPFLKRYNDLDALKLRFGWGETGNARTGGIKYLAPLDNATFFSPVFGVDQQVAHAQYMLYSFPSLNYHWETSVMTNFGADLTMFRGRLNATIEYYLKDINDLLVQTELSSIFGRAGRNANPWVNLGALRNQGFEFNGQWRDNIGKFSYGINTNFTTVKNTVRELLVPVTRANNITRLGHSIGELYGYVSEGIIQSGDNYQNYPLQDGIAPLPGDIKLKDLNRDGIIDTKDRTAIGKVIPSYNYSLGVNIGYSNFDMNVFLYGIGDFQVFNKQRMDLSTFNDQDMEHNKLLEWKDNQWTETNPTNAYVRAVLPKPGSSEKFVKNNLLSTFWIEDGSFLRIKDIQLGYSVPAAILKKIYMSNLRIYANVSNLYTFTQYRGRDPEAFISVSQLESGTDNGAYSLPRSFTFGLQIGL